MTNSLIDYVSTKCTGIKFKNEIVNKLLKKDYDVSIACIDSKEVIMDDKESFCNNIHELSMSKSLVNSHAKCEIEDRLVPNHNEINIKDSGSSWSDTKKHNVPIKIDNKCSFFKLIKNV